MDHRIFCAAIFLGSVVAVAAQLTTTNKAFTQADTLRGSLGPGRTWWDATYYDVSVRPDYANRTIAGRTIIAFNAVAPGARMQIDLQQPLVVDSITSEVSVFANGAIEVQDKSIPFVREDNVIWIDAYRDMGVGTATTLTVHYHGTPREARNPPWDGGWIWKKDERGNPWMSVACQGLGASVWYPCKDHQSDEPEGVALHIIVPDTLVGVGNGRSKGTTSNGDGTTTWHWSVTNPINTYNLIPYIGKYVHFGEVYTGLDGALDLEYWVLAHNEAKAREQFKQVPGMMACFEDWLDPFPFYTDGYKLVEAPHLGMEHQSAIAYGNGYMNGYRGMDLSGTGHGLKWDFIIVHESGHEWFGNNITTADIADMWIHEGFTQYTEVIQTECLLGKTAGQEYLIGLRGNIRNDRPVIGPYGVNEEGSGDMYPKGASVVHMVRQVLDNDSLFKVMLRTMNRNYRHAIVTSAEIETFMDGYTPMDLRPMFDLYLRSTRIPVLEWGYSKGRIWRRWSNVPEDFSMPIRMRIDENMLPIHLINTEWKATPLRFNKRASLTADPNWYVDVSKVPKSKLKGLRATSTSFTPSF